MTEPESLGIELNPGKTNRLNFDSFVIMNLPGKKVSKLRLSFKLIWLAHQTYPIIYNQRGLRLAHYWHLKEDIEEKLSKERNSEVKLNITKETIKITLKRMRKVGYMRYVPLEDKWYFSGKAASTLKKLSKEVGEFQKPARDNRHAKHLIHDFSFGV